MDARAQRAREAKESASERGRGGGGLGEKKRRGEEEEEKMEKEEREERRRRRGPRGEGFSRGCRSVGVASASSRVRLTSDLLLKRFHSFPSSPSLAPSRPGRSSSLLTSGLLSHADANSRTYARTHARTCVRA